MIRSCPKLAGLKREAKYDELDELIEEVVHKRQKKYGLSMFGS